MGSTLYLYILGIWELLCEIRWWVEYSLQNLRLAQQAFNINYLHDSPSHNLLQVYYTIRWYNYNIETNLLHGLLCILSVINTQHWVCDWGKSGGNLTVFTKRCAVSLPDFLCVRKNPNSRNMTYIFLNAFRKLLGWAWKRMCPSAFSRFFPSWNAGMI